MFACMPQANAQAIERTDALIERADIMELRLKRRHSLRRPALEAAADLAGQPGLALGAATDHHGIGARRFERCECFLIRSDVAIDDEGNGDGIAHRADRVPIGLALVKLAAGAAMYRDELDAGGFGAARQLRRVTAAVV